MTSNLSAQLWNVIASLDAYNRGYDAKTKPTFVEYQSNGFII